MFEKIPKARHTLIEHADSVEAIIPAKRNVFLIAFLSFWLVGWAFGEITAPLAVFKNPHAGAFLFIVFWLTLWTVGGAFAIYTWLWMIAGREIVSVSNTALSVKREILGFGRKRSYDITEVKNLRVAPWTINPYDFSAGMKFWGLGGGPIAFDYGAKTFRVGAGLEEAESDQIVQRLKQAFPVSRR